jgi:hypothetical protein
MFKKWDVKQGKFIDIRYESYDKQEYPYRKYLKNNCNDCPDNVGIGYDHDSLFCRKCIGFEK